VKHPSDEQHVPSSFISDKVNLTSDFGGLIPLEKKESTAKAKSNTKAGPPALRKDDN
jgi:hypothetical protein